MGQIYTGLKGEKYSIIMPALAKGGEGAIYKIVDKPDYVLKIFLDGKQTESRHRKLLAMIGTQLPNEALNQVTWPIDVIYDNNRFVGYLMPRLEKNDNLNVIYSDNDSFTLFDKIRIAKNLCSAINAVHSVGQVCGDLNPNNISVNPQNGRVTLVDTDSYHIKELNSSRVYRCEVGMPNYIARELQDKMKNGNNLMSATLPTFSEYTDLFALAVHIFALLMNGCHPFSTSATAKQLFVNQPSIVNPQPIENIYTGFFPFHIKKSGYSIPLYAPDFNILPQNIRALFIRAFIDGHTNPSKRPDSAEWYKALSTISLQDFKICSTNKSHMFPNHYPFCPWCKIRTDILQATTTSLHNNINNSVKPNYISQNSISRPHVVLPTSPKKIILPTTIRSISPGTKATLAIIFALFLFIFVNNISKSNNNITPPINIIENTDTTRYPEINSETEENIEISNEDSGFILPNSNEVYITRSYLESLSQDQLRIARNEIYARYGRKFKDDSLQNYFNSQSWYLGTINPDAFSENIMNDFALANINLISSYEKEMGYK